MRYFALLIFSSFLLITSCKDEVVVAAPEGIPFAGQRLNFDHAFLSRERSVPNGTFRTQVTILENPATFSLIDGITGLPADAFQITINSGADALTIPDGTYSLGNPDTAFNFSSSILKNNLLPTFNDPYVVKAGIFRVSTTDAGLKLFSFALQCVKFDDFFAADAEIIDLNGETTVEVIIAE